QKCPLGGGQNRFGLAGPFPAGPFVAAAALLRYPHRRDPAVHASLSDTGWRRLFGQGKLNWTVQSSLSIPPNMRSTLLIIVVAVVLALGGGAGWHWWTSWRFQQSTDDAYVQSDITVIAPKVEGYLK